MHDQTSLSLTKKQRPQTEGLDRDSTAQMRKQFSPSWALTTWFVLLIFLPFSFSLGPALLIECSGESPTQTLALVHSIQCWARNQQQHLLQKAHHSCHFFHCFALPWLRKALPFDSFFWLLTWHLGSFLRLSSGSHHCCLSVFSALCLCPLAFFGLYFSSVTLSTVSSLLFFYVYRVYHE